MAVGDASSEMLKLRTRESARYHADLRFQILPLSLLMLALVITTGAAFFRTDFWLLGAAFISLGFLAVSSLLYLASRRMRASRRIERKGADVKHLGTGTASAAVGSFALLAVTGDAGAVLGDYRILVAQLGFALTIVGGFWLLMTVRDLI